MWFLAVAAAAEPPDVDTPLRTGAKAPADAAVVVGLEDYVFLPDVPYASRDADAFADLLISTIGVPVARVERLTAGGREQLVAAVERAGAATGTGGTVWLYFAGHGVASPSDGRRLLLGDDARQAPEAFEARGVPVEDLEALAAAGGARVVTLIDACFNGTGRSGEAVVAGTRFAVPDWVGGAVDGRLQWAAAGPDQVARPLDAARHGAFTFLAVGALRGWADGEVDGARDGAVTAAEAQLYLSRGLRTLGLRDQSPVLKTPDPEGWVLSPRAPEAPPALAEGWSAAPAPSGLVAPPLVVGAGPRFDPGLVEAAAAFQVTLPLRKTTFGYRDAAGERVRGDTYLKLAKATERGRKGLTLRNAGLVTTVAGWGAAFGFGTAAMATGDAAWVWPAIGGGAALFTGVGLTVAGQTLVTTATDPLLP